MIRLIYFIKIKPRETSQNFRKKQDTFICYKLNSYFHILFVVPLFIFVFHPILLLFLVIAPKVEGKSVFLKTLFTGPGKCWAWNILNAPFLGTIFLSTIQGSKEEMQPTVLLSYAYEPHQQIALSWDHYGYSKVVHMLEVINKPQIRFKTHSTRRTCVELGTYLITQC